jgi:uncharacterized NAD-dependent epimerase/dehydratase family protein
MLHNSVLKDRQSNKLFKSTNVRICDLRNLFADLSAFAEYTGSKVAK